MDVDKLVYRKNILRKNMERSTSVSLCSSCEDLSDAFMSVFIKRKGVGHRAWCNLLPDDLEQVKLLVGLVHFDKVLF